MTKWACLKKMWNILFFFSNFQGGTFNSAFFSDMGVTSGNAFTFERGKLSLCQCDIGAAR